MARRVGKQAPLQRRAVVELAISIGDSGGLEAVTIRRLALELGVTPMALYWHFRDKDALLDGIAEELFRAIVWSQPASLGWAGELRTLLADLLAALRPHPNLAQLVTSRALESEPGLDAAERLLGLLVRGGFDARQVAEVGSYLLYAVVALVGAEPGPDHLVDDANRDEVVRVRRARLASLSPDRFPTVAGAAEFLADCRDETTYFDRGLDLLVAGTQELVRAG